MQVGLFEGTKDVSKGGPQRGAVSDTGQVDELAGARSLCAIEVIDRLTGSEFEIPT